MKLNKLIATACVGMAFMTLTVQAETQFTFHKLTVYSADKQKSGKCLALLSPGITTDMAAAYCELSYSIDTSTATFSDTAQSTQCITLGNVKIGSCGVSSGELHADGPFILPYSTN